MNYFDINLHFPTFYSFHLKIHISQTGENGSWTVLPVGSVVLSLLPSDPVVSFHNVRGAITKGVLVRSPTSDSNRGRSSRRCSIVRYSV